MASRQANKERTKSKLIQATLKVLLREGPASLTTGRVAKAAGVAQPTFYVHFSGLDEVLDHAAELVESTFSVGLDSEERLSRPPGAVTGMSDRIEAIVEVLTAERRYAELFLRFRRDNNSPLGQRWQRVTDRIRRMLIEEFMQLWPDLSKPEIELHGALAVGMVLGLVEDVIDGRTQNLSYASTIAANAAIASVRVARKLVEAA